MTTKEWRKLTKWIRLKFYPRQQVIIKRKPIKECGRVFTEIYLHYITVDIQQCDILQKDTLLHEWAHIMADEHGGEKRVHGPKWARWYGRIYEAWEKDPC
jgi:hypothetical protein